MIKELYQKIVDNQDIRKNLIEIKKLIKDQKNKKALLYLLGEDFNIFIRLLSSEDAKTRKNAALILGELEREQLVCFLFDAYEKEEQMFVKSSYLNAISNYNYSNYIDRLKDRLEILSACTPEETSVKHIREEISVLQDMIIRVETPKKHSFIGFYNPLELILTTNPGHKSVVASQIINHKVSELSMGLKVNTKDIKSILPVRTYYEILFSLNITETEIKPSDLGRQLAGSNLLTLLESCHKEAAPFYFRIELKSRMTLEKRSLFVKKLASELEEKTHRKLRNSVSNYEIELRLVENPKGNYHVYLKLYTLEDNRFAYRVNTLAASINPVTAALIAQLSKKYMKEEAQILDPFCGVGTMLVERNRLVKGRVFYGIDFYGEAIKKAKDNTKKEDILINYIQRDFFDFRHTYTFDEIITNMPARQGSQTKEDIERIYRRFFRKSKELLAAQGIIIMYSGEKDFVKKYLRFERDMKLVQEFLIDRREDTYVFIIELTRAGN